MNGLQKYFDNDNTLNDRLQLLYKFFIKKYLAHGIVNKTEFLYDLKNKIQELVDTVDKPTCKFKKAYFTPVSEDYNSMIKSALDDIQLNLYKYDEYDKLISNSFSDVTITKEMINNRLRYLWNLLDELKVVINEYSIDDNINIIEAFDRNDYKNRFTANIDNDDNILTLPLSINKINKSNILVKIDDTNGYPGNTHLVDDNKNEISFKGLTGIHGNLNDITTSNANTYFEIELFNIDDNVLEKTNYLGFEYKENKSWVTNDKYLYLNLTITPSKSESCNNIKLVPFINNDNNYIPCFITKVLISDKGSNVKLINLNTYFDKTMIINFDTQVVKEVKLYFKQEYNYKCNICHIYSLKNIYTDVYTNEPIDEIYNRYDLYKPSYECLGYKYDNTTGNVIFPSNDKEYTYNETQIKNTILSLPNTLSIYNNYIESIEAYRYMIGITSVTISNKQYKEEGEFISDDYIFDSEIKEIQLFAEEDIKNDEKIKYYITFNDGIDWVEIFPRERAYEGVCNIKINSDIPIYERDEKESMYIDRLLSTKNFRLKIVLKRGVNINSTPIVYGYKLKVKTYGDDEYYVD